MLIRTFDEWKAAGYHVIKGQKSTGRNAAGKATFNEKQVELQWKNRPDYGEGSDYEEDYDIFMAEYGYGRDWT